MKRFLIKILAIIFAFAGLLAIVLSQVDPQLDEFYLKFTTPEQSNLILGTSRAAQAVRPDVLDSLTGKEFYNYAFTLGQSPYGPVYLKSIKSKIDPDEKNGVFILCVSPWSISSKSADPNDEDDFRELGLALDNTPFTTWNPNYLYLLNNFKGRYRQMFSNNNKPYMHLHDDGWLEIDVDMSEGEVQKRTFEKIERYRESTALNYKLSSLRLEYLEKTIKFLNSHGQVYLVRLPVDPLMLEIEDKFMPNFNQKLMEVAKSTNGYLDLTTSNNEFQYVDGNHIYKESGKKVTSMIAELIN
jgi:hypothetical protein